MAADSDGPGGGGSGGGWCGVVVTCEGDLRDPCFPARLSRLLRDLKALIADPLPQSLKVNKVEPWNSVRVTLSVPRAAAARLRALAAGGAPQLRALGILSVQLDGDAAVSLRLQHGTELTINADGDDASTSRSQPNAELLAGLEGLGRLMEGESSTSTTADTATSSSASPRDNFKSPNTVCPMDGKIPQNIPTPTTDRCEFPFGSMTQARVIHRKENTLGLSGPSSGIRPQSDGLFARPSTSAFAGPPPPYPAQASTSGNSCSSGSSGSSGGSGIPSPAPPTVAMSSPLLVNLLQNDAPAPQPRPKPPPHPAKLDRLDDGQVELAVGRAPFEYRAPRTPAPMRMPSSPASPALPSSPSPRPMSRPAPYVRRAFAPARPGPLPPPPSSPIAYRGAPAPNATVVPRSRLAYPAEAFGPPPPYGVRQGPTRVPIRAPGPPTAPTPPPPPPPLPPPPSPTPHSSRVTHEDLQALLPPPTTSMDQKTQSSFQEFQRYQQQYNALQRANSRNSSQADWNEPYRDSLSGLQLPDLPDTDLDQLLPTLGADLNLDDPALSAISDLDPGSKLDLLYDPSNQDGHGPELNPTPDALLQEITGHQYGPTVNGPYEPPVPSNANDVPSKSDSFGSESNFMPPPPVPQHPTPKYQTSPIGVSHHHHPPFKSPPVSYATTPSSTLNSDRVMASQVNQVSQINQVNQVSQMGQINQVGQISQGHQANQMSQANQVSQMSQMNQASQMSQANQVSQMNQVNQGSQMYPVNQVNQMSQANQMSQMNQVSQASSMPPPMRLPIRASASVTTATVGSQATAQEIEEQSKQYLIKTLMRDDDIPPPKEQEKKSEEVTVAQCKMKESTTETVPEMFGIAKSIPEEDCKKEDEMKLKNKMGKKEKDDRLIAQKGGKPRTAGAKERPPSLKDKLIRDGKFTKVALPRPQVAKPATPVGESPKSPPGEKESIKLRLTKTKLDKNEPVIQPVYKADVSFVNQQKGEKSTDGELRVPPLHISLKGRNSAVIKNSKKEKKKFSPGDLHTKKVKIKKAIEDEKSHRRDSEESIASKSSDTADNKTDEYLNVKGIKLNNHYEADSMKTEITGDNNVVYRMKTISKNAHIVTKSNDYKLNNKLQMDMKMKKKFKILSDSKLEKEKDWKNDTLDKEGKYAQNEGYREMSNNHDVKKKLPGGLECVGKFDKSSDGKTVQSDVDRNKGASEKCNIEWTLKDSESLKDSDNKLKRTLTESAITSPNGLIACDKKRKISHSSLPDPPGSTNVGTIATRVESPPSVSSQRSGATSPRRKERPKDKSYCKLVAERAARPDTDKFVNRSPTSQAQGEDSGIESMDALSEKSPNQASQSPPGPQRKERLDMPRSTSPTSVQRIIGVIDQPPPSDELLERLSLATGQPHYDTVPPDIDDLGDIEAELAKMHADHINGDDARSHPKDRLPTPILRDDGNHAPGKHAEGNNIHNPEHEQMDAKESSQADKDHISPKREHDFDPLPSRISPPLYTYSNQEKVSPDVDLKDEKTIVENGEIKDEGADKRDTKMERLPLKADFPDKSLLEQLLIEIPTPEYVGKRAESPSPSSHERVPRSSVRTRSSSKMNSPADGPRTPRVSPTSPALQPLQPRNCLRDGSVDKNSPRGTAITVQVTRVQQAPKRKRRESESSGASTMSCEEGLSPAARPKKKPRRVDTKPLNPAVPTTNKIKKESDSDSDEPLICKVRGKPLKGARGRGVVKAAEGVGTRRSVRQGLPPPPAAPAPPVAIPLATPVRRKTRSAVGEGGTAGTTPGAVRRRRASRDGK